MIMTLSIYYYWTTNSSILAFTARRYASAVYAVVVCPSVNPSLCPSDRQSFTRCYCVKMAKHRITETTPGTLVFWCQNLGEIRRGRTRCIELWQSRWPWVTPNPTNHSNFYILHCLSYLCSRWTKRLQISCAGWSYQVPANGWQIVPERGMITVTRPL